MRSWNRLVGAGAVLALGGLLMVVGSGLTGRATGTDGSDPSVEATGCGGDDSEVASQESALVEGGGTRCDNGSCNNGVRDGCETDVDCGGAVCVNRCALGKHCVVHGDCASGLCYVNSCQVNPPVNSSCFCSSSTRTWWCRNGAGTLYNSGSNCYPSTF